MTPQIQLVMEAGADRIRENLPTNNEVAVIIAEEYDKSYFRDIVLAYRGQNGGSTHQFSHIDPHHTAYMPLHYVLLFPKGNLEFC